jgi:hypothetical protein
MESCVKGIAGSCVGGAEMAQAQWAASARTQGQWALEGRLALAWVES